MSWNDRDYNRSGYGGGAGNTLRAIFTGSVPIGTYFGIRVRVHASLIGLVILTLLFNYTQGYGLRDRAISMGALFVIILLHEFGHCFAARSVGGFAEDILMWPLGGLAYASPPQRPWPTFVTVAGGPLVNVLICVGTAGAIWTLTGRFVSLDPFHPLLFSELWRSDVAIWLWWIFYMSYALLLFNLLPIYPLDGGQMLQSILWPHMGFYRSTDFACLTGIVGSCFMAFYGVTRGQFLLIFIGIASGLYCYQKRMALKEMGPEGSQEYVDYGASLRMGDQQRRRKRSRRAMKRAQRRALQEQAEQARIDAILEKVSAHGMNSLTWLERRALRKATERQRQRDLEQAGRNL